VEVLNLPHFGISICSHGEIPLLLEEVDFMRTLRNKARDLQGAMKRQGLC